METQTPDRRHRRATVVFADISGFTGLAERFDPERLLELTEACHAAMERATIDFGGTIDKFIGDAVMALFGAEKGLEDTAGRALEAALEMRRAVGEIAHRFQLPPHVGLHVGIDTGNMIAGKMGGEERRDFSVLGDVVNVAARLQGKASAGEILVGPATHNEARGRYRFEPLGLLALSGREEPVEAFAVTGSAESEAGNPGVLPLLGRSREVAAFKTLLEGLEQAGSVLWLRGEPGIGKSRLLAECIDLAREKNVRCATGRAETTGRLRTFRALAELLEELLAIGPGVSDERARAAVINAYQEAGMQTDARSAALMAGILGREVASPQKEAFEELEPDVMRVLQQKAVADLLTGFARQGPLVLCLEDVHWLDASSRNILENLFWLAREFPVVFVLTTRPDFPETTGSLASALGATGGVKAETLDLAPLDPAESREVLLNALGRTSIAAELRTEVSDRAGGNPFYLEEIARTLQELEAADEGEVSSLRGEVPLPGTIEETIMARVDRLEADERKLLEFASVLGRVAPLRLLEETAPNDLDAPAVVQRLTERGILLVDEEAPTPGGEFRFTHALVQEATYKGLLSSRRKQLHGLLARQIGDLFGETGLGGLHAMLAMHFLAAGDPEAAEPHLVAAGDEAARNAASAEALEFFENAYRIREESTAGEPREDGALLERKLATALLLAGHHERARPFFDAAAAGLGETRRWTTQRQANFYLAADLARIFFRVFVRGGRMSRRQADAEMRERLSLLYERARAESIADPEHFIFDSMRLTALVTSVDPTSVKQSFSLYAGAALLFAYTGLSFRISRRFAAIAGELVHESNPDDVFTYRLMLFLADYFEGNWEQDPDIDAELIEKVLATGRLWDVDTFLCMDHIKAIEQGDFERASRHRAGIRTLLEVYGYRFSATTRDALEVFASFGERRWEDGLAAVEIYKRSPMPMLNLLAAGLEGRILVELEEWDRLDTVLETGRRLEKEIGRVTPFHGCYLAIARQAAALHSFQTRGRNAQRAAEKSAREAAQIARRMAAIRVPNLRLRAQLAAAKGDEAEALRLEEKAHREATRLGQRRELVTMNETDTAGCSESSG